MVYRRADVAAKRFQAGDVFPGRSSWTMNHPATEQRLINEGSEEGKNRPFSRSGSATLWSAVFVAIPLARRLSSTNVVISWLTGEDLGIKDDTLATKTLTSSCQKTDAARRLAFLAMTDGAGYSLEG